jgi:hypothetical protein
VPENVLHLADAGAVDSSLGEKPPQRMPGIMRRIIAGEGGTARNQTGDDRSDIGSSVS